MSKRPPRPGNDEPRRRSPRPAHLAGLVVALALGQVTSGCAGWPLGGRRPDDLRGTPEQAAARVLSRAIQFDTTNPPGDERPLAEYLVGVLRRAGDRVDVLAIALDHRVAHVEVVVGIDRALFRFEVAYMAIRCKHLEVAAEVLLQCLRLGRRLHDE